MRHYAGEVFICEFCGQVFVSETHGLLCARCTEQERQRERDKRIAAWLFGLSGAYLVGHALFWIARAWGLL